MTRGRAFVAALLALSGSLILGGCAAAPASPATPSTVAAGTPSTGAASTPTATSTQTPAAAPTPVVQVPVADASLGAAIAPSSVAPVRLGIAGIDLDMSIDPMGVTAEGLMDLPPDTAVAGWYRFGPGVHASRGSTVIAAHVDSNAYGLGPFVRLKELAPGAEISVQAADGSTARYTVTAVTTTVKADVPLADVFSSTGPHRLMLVTCGGDFDYDTRHYLSNVIVEADPSP